LFLGKFRVVGVDLGVNDPIKVLISLFRATGTTLDSAEQARFPFNTLIGSLGSLFTLTVFDLGLLVCGGFVIPGDDGLDSGMP